MAKQRKLSCFTKHKLYAIAEQLPHNQRAIGLRKIRTPLIASFPGSTTKPGNEATGPFQFPVLPCNVFTFDMHKAGAMLGHKPQNTETEIKYVSDRGEEHMGGVSD